MLQNFIENGNGFSFGGEGKNKKSSRGNSHELELQIGIVYNEVGQMLEEAGVRYHEEATKTSDKVTALKSIVEMLLSKMGGTKERANESNIISC